MKALTFLEWVKLQNGDYYWYDRETQFINKVYEVANFYNQPFTVDFLVNPVMADDVNIKPLIQQSESLRLFEGWGDNTCYDVIHGGSKVASNEYKLMYCDEFVMAFETLNDFITLCNLEGIELQFNKSNETIRNLFGKE